MKFSSIGHNMSSEMKHINESDQWYKRRINSKKDTHRRINIIDSIIKNHQP